jgi:hypothetical protein
VARERAAGKPCLLSGATEDNRRAAEAAAPRAAVPQEKDGAVRRPGHPLRKQPDWREEVN